MHQSRHDLECAQGIATDSSVLGTRNKHKLLARQRHALFNDFTLTIPFGIVNIVAGFLSLFFKVNLWKAIEFARFLDLEEFKHLSSGSVACRVVGLEHLSVWQAVYCSH